MTLEELDKKKLDDDWRAFRTLVVLGQTAKGMDGYFGMDIYRQYKKEIHELLEVENITPSKNPHAVARRLLGVSTNEDMMMIQNRWDASGDYTFLIDADTTDGSYSMFIFFEDNNPEKYLPQKEYIDPYPV